MEDLQRSESRDESLNDSWVELHFHSRPERPQVSVAAAAAAMSQEMSGSAMPRPQFLSGQMEKLLLEAQRESSRSSSRNTSVTSSSRGSPKSPHSPNNELATDPITTIQEGPTLLQTSDWIWDWSSRPEVQPPSEWGRKFQHPRRHKLSVRNTSVMRSGLFSLENLPTLLLTHACSFLVGAAMMFMYLKKYCRWVAVTTVQSLD